MGEGASKPPDIHVHGVAFSLEKSEQWEDVQVTDLRHAMDLLSTWAEGKLHYPAAAAVAEMGAYSSAAGWSEWVCD